jgi:hypothetical protein
MGEEVYGGGSDEKSRELAGDVVINVEQASAPT